MVEITVPNLKPLPDNKLVLDRQFAPSFGATADAHLTNYFSTAIADNIAQIQGLPEVDPQFSAKDFLVEKGIDFDSPKAQYILRNAFNRDSAERAFQTQLATEAAQSVIEEAGFLKSTLANPFILAELSGTLGTLGALKVGKTFLQKRMLRNVIGAEREYTLAQQGLRVGTATEGFFAGAANLVEATNRMNFGEPLNIVALQEARDAALSTALAGGFGFGVGKGITAYQKRQRDSLIQGAARAVSNLQELHKSIDSKPPKVDSVAPRGLTEEPLDIAEGDLDFRASWFTNSVFYKALPTPMKAVINSNGPNAVKLRFLRLANDAGVGFKLHQLGKTLGPSVFQESGQLAGKWADVHDQLNKIWGEMNPRGAAEIADVPIQNALEHLRKVAGKESLTFNDFGRRISDLYITGAKPANDLEAQAVNVLRKYFDDWDKALNEVGLLNGTGTMVKKKVTLEGRVSSLEDITSDILKSNRDFLEKRSQDLDAKIRGLNQQFKSRGLTAKQQELLASLKAEKVTITSSLAKSLEIRSASDAIKFIDELSLSAKQAGTIKKLSKHIDEMKDRLDNVESFLNGSAVEKGLTEPFFPRYFNRRAISARRDEFEDILTQHFIENPQVWKFDEKTNRFVKQVLDSDEASARRRAQQSIKEILEEVDDDGIENAYFGMGRTKHLIGRKLDIPNYKVKDFIVTDLKDVLVSYNARIAGKYAFAKQFRNKQGAPATLDDLLEENTKDMIAAGMKQSEINRINKEFVGTYDRIVGRVLTKPDSMSSRVANWMRTATQWTYLGGAGLAAVADFANIFMDHELKVIAKGVLSLADDNSLKLSKAELKKSGDGLEIIAGQTQLKYMENLTSDPLRNGMADKINNSFYIANLLAPVTVIAKSMDAMFRGHTILEAAERLAANKASQWEIEFLARYDIDQTTAVKLSKMPFEKTNNGLILPNTDAWLDENLTSVFRNALKSGVMSRIIMGTPADKPQIMAGKTYIPMSVAKSFGMKESKRAKGYAAIESPLLALPFTFYTFTFGAFNKITTNYAQGLVRNKSAHFLVSMFLGYQILKARTPSWALNEMDVEDKALRAFDFSGLASLYSDLFYRYLDTSMAFDLANPTPFEPRFKEEPDPVRGVVSFGGAPADYVYGFVKSGKDFADGNYGDGAEEFIRGIPLIWNMFTREIARDIKDNIGDAFRGLE